MNTHADFHFVLADFKAGVTHARHGAGGQRHAHRADVGAGLERNALDLVERQSCRGSSARAFIHEEDARHAAAAVRLALGGRRSGGDVLARDDALHADILLHVRHFSCHIEVENIAVIVSVDVQHARALIDFLGYSEHLFRTGGLEHITDGTSVEHAFAHIAKEQREMSGAASGRNAHLACVLALRNKAVKISLNAHQFVRVRGIDAFQHFGNECFRCVDDFFHRLVSPSIR